MSEEELDLSELSLEELYEQMGDDLYDGYQEEVVEGVEEALSRGEIPYDVLTKGLVAGMDIVGVDFRDGILFVCPNSSRIIGSCTTPLYWRWEKTVGAIRQ